MLTFGLSQLCAFSPSACNWAQTFTGSNLDYSVVFLCSAGGSVFICKHTKASRRHRQCSVKQTHTVPASYGHFVGKIDLKWYPVGSPGNAVFSMGLFQVLSYMSSFNPHNSPMMEGWVFFYPFFFSMRNLRQLPQDCTAPECRAEIQTQLLRLPRLSFLFCTVSVPLAAPS